MRFTERFIRRPVMTTLIMAGLLIFGVVSYFKLPVSYLPAIDFPVIQVTASLPGAEAQTMASSVAGPLEREFSAISGLKALSSVNSQGLTQVTLEFELDRDIDAAAMDVQAAISKAGGDLPDNLSGPPYYEKVNPSDQPILYLSVSSDVLPLSRVNAYARSYISESISMISGVAKVIIYGEQKYAVRVKLDPRETAARSLGYDDVVAAIEQANVDLPLGSLTGPRQALTLTADGRLMTAEPYNDVVVDYQDGRPVRIRDLGRAEDGVEDDETGAWYNGRRMITLAVKRQPGSNTVAVVDRIKKVLPTLTEQLPASIKVDVIHDRSALIEESVVDVQFTLLLAVCLVILVVFLFLRSLSGTLVAATAVPFSIVAAFAVMYAFGFTLDNLSLLALTLSVGFVVDDAIVMLENIVRHMEMGKKPFQAAVDGAGQIGFTIISMTLSLSVVFIPVMFMAGVLGRLLFEFAVTITAAILVSGVVSLSLTPMLASRVIRGRLASSGKVFNRVEHAYRRGLTWALSHRPATMIAAALALALCIYFFAVIPKGLLPSEDMNVLTGFVEGEQGVSFDAMAESQRSLTPAIQADPAVASVLQVVGLGKTNEGVVIVLLKPVKDRKAGADQVLGRLWPQVNQAPGVMTFLQNPPMISLSSRSTKSPYQFTLYSPESGLLYQKAAEFTEKMKALPMLVGVTSDLEMDNPQIDVAIDRDKAAAHGVSPRAVEEALMNAYAGRRASTINAPDDEYKVIVELDDQYQNQPEDLTEVYLKSRDGRMVRLDAVTDFKPDYGPLTINHVGQLPSVTVSFNIKPGVSLGQASAAVKNLAAEALPGEISHRFEGEAGAFSESLSSALFLLILAIFAIYLILGILYESFIHPLTILSGLPSAALGGLLILMLFDLELNLYGMVGLILLIGIVMKNAIMVVDFALEGEREGRPARDAVLEGALVRFRPILMTTAAAAMGAAPIAVGFGAGGQARQPLGLVVVGGLILSQVVTLFLTPVFYTYMDGLRRGRSG